MEFTLTERTEPLTLKEVLDFIDDTNISKMDAHELKSRIVDVVQDTRNKAIDEVVEKLKERIYDNAESFRDIRFLTVEAIDIFVFEIAEQMKGE